MIFENKANKKDEKRKEARIVFPNIKSGNY